eukprot:8273871-Ditylum_brightwellii.AAC.1
MPRLCQLPILGDMSFNLIFVTGVHNEARKEWQRWPMVEKTWANFRQHFTKVHEELLEWQKAARQAWYTANMASTNDLHECTADALSQLFVAMEEDHTM